MAVAANTGVNGAYGMADCYDNHSRRWNGRQQRVKNSEPRSGKQCVDSEVNRSENGARTVGGARRGAMLAVGRRNRGSNRAVCYGMVAEGGARREGERYGEVRTEKAESGDHRQAGERARTAHEQ